MVGSLRSGGGASGHRFAAFVLCLTLGATGCESLPGYAPQAPRDPASLAPPGEREPVRGADRNPLDVPAVVEVVCNAQGTPLLDNDEIRGCEQDGGCRVRCQDAPLSAETE